MAYVIQTNQTVKAVKNLGWLLRNWSAVERLEWLDTPHSLYRNEGLFRAYLRDGRVYTTAYASFDVWKGFINRPVFRGLTVTVNGVSGEI